MTIMNHLKAINDEVIHLEHSNQDLNNKIELLLADRDELKAEVAHMTALNDDLLRQVSNLGRALAASCGLSPEEHRITVLLAGGIDVDTIVDKCNVPLWVVKRVSDCPKAAELVKLINAYDD